jgi:hypothetical protein
MVLPQRGLRRVCGARLVSPVIPENSSSGWVTTAEVARLAGLRAVRSIELAVRRSRRGTPWRGTLLHTRVGRASHGGGTNGTIIEISVHSLPLELRIKYENEHAALRADTETSASALLPAASGGLWQKRHALLQHAIDAIADGRSTTPVLTDISRRSGVPVSTLARWLRRLRGGGAGALNRKQRSDAGSRRAVISIAIDRALKGRGISEATLTEIAGRLRKHAASCYAKGAPGDRHVVAFLNEELAAQVRASGVALSEDEQKSIARVPRHFARQCNKTRILAVYSNDRKKFHDLHEARIRRDPTDLLPMQLVAGDVHRCDVQRQRDDKSTHTARAVCWYDFGTQRVFASIFLFEKGHDICQEHVAASLLDMIEAWGVPMHLYLDNGSEYAWAETITPLLDASRLLGQSVTRNGGPYHGEVLRINDSSYAAIVRSRPYRPTGKGIEVVFSSMARGPFVMLPGFIGGNRAVKITHNLGDEPDAFKGSADLFIDALKLAFNYRNAMPLSSGPFKGRSPNDVYQQRVTERWAPVTVDRYVAEALFAKDVTARVRNMSITVAGVPYTGDSLARFVGQYALVRLPISGDRHRLLVLDDTRLPCGYVERARLFSPLDKEGARDKARKDKALKGQLVALRSELHPVDFVAEMRRVAAPKGAVALPAPGPRIIVSAEVAQQAVALKALDGLPAPDSERSLPSPPRRSQIAALIESANERNDRHGK